jgi:RimJ/RimL family protein N-acetyltransferase
VSDIILTTERLTLTPTRAADFDDSAALWGDAEVTRFLGGQVSTAQQAWNRVLRNIGHWTALGYGYWTARERGTDRFVGEIGFADFRRDGADPRFLDTPEAGWALSPWAQRQGLASEAVAAAHAWIDRRFPGSQTVCMIDEENLPSQRLAARFGYVEYGRTNQWGSPIILYERQR